MSGTNWRNGTYTTLRECAWVRDLAARDPDALAQYAAILRAGPGP